MTWPSPSAVVPGRLPLFELDRNLTARVGGRLLEVHEPDTTEELAATARRLRDAGRSYRVLGGGSNIADRVE